jgi:hypothetical protein
MADHNIAHVGVNPVRQRPLNRVIIKNFDIFILKSVFKLLC